MNIKKALRILKNYNAEIAVFAGSGLKEIIKLENPKTVSYKALGFQFADISGHERCLEFGEFLGKKIVLASRFHYYEDGSSDDMYNLHLLLKALGVKTIISTTATGGINPDFQPGDIMLVKDHINFSSTNPFVGKLPVKFVDMTNAYTKHLREKVKDIAKKQRIKLYEGTHIQVIGPSYETPAEVKFFRMIGADTVSMSLVHGAILARHLDMEFVAFASVSNKAVEENSIPLTHEEVVKVSEKAAKKLAKIISKLIGEL